MKHILVPIDYSERSREALHCAAMLAAGLDAFVPDPAKHSLAAGYANH